MRKAIARLIRVGLLAVALSLVAAAASFGAEVGYWSFNEGSGTFIGDSSGFGNHGTLVNSSFQYPGTTWVSGKFGAALHFGGTVGPGSTRVEVPDSPSLRLSTAGSFAAWVWSEDIFRDAPVISKVGPGGLLSYWFGTFGPSGAGHWGNLFDQDGNEGWDFNGRDQGAIPASQWVHIATTWDGCRVLYYVNGHLTNTAAWMGTIHPSNARLFIGGNSEYTFEPYAATAFRGAIDEVHIYDNAISAKEVARLASVPEPTIVGIFSMGLLALLACRCRSMVWIGRAAHCILGDSTVMGIPRNTVETGSVVALHRSRINRHAYNHVV